MYRDLEVRHLGSIYEGLLEYQPRYAPEDMVIVSQKKGETVEPSSAHPTRDVAYRAGEVYLVTDKGERKATGSNWTSLRQCCAITKGLRTSSIQVSAGSNR